MRINKAKSWFYGNDTPGNIHDREEKQKQTLLEMEKEQTYKGCRH